MLTFEYITNKITFVRRSGGMADAQASGACYGNIVWVQVPSPASPIKYSGVRGSVGTGRRARLRILWWVHRVGSSPIFRSQIGNRNVSDLFYYLKGKTSLEINDAHAGRSDAGQYLSFLSAILHYDICRCFKGQKNCRSMISSLKWNRRGSNP